ncbi:146_t:CDS:2, partial [Racocetra persica]
MDYNQSDYESDKYESNQSGDIIINKNVQNYESNQSDQVVSSSNRLINFNQKSSVKKHASSDQHIDTIRLEAAKNIANEASTKSIQKSEAHVLMFKNCIFSYSSIIYENEISGCEFALAISDTIKAEIWKEISKTVSFGIMIDKSSDITMKKHLEIYVIYSTASGNIITHFLQLLAPDKCDAETITTILVRLFQSYNVMDKLVAFASDGASVIIGNK